MLESFDIFLPLPWGIFICIVRDVAKFIVVLVVANHLWMGTRQQGSRDFLEVYLKFAWYPRYMLLAS